MIDIITGLPARPHSPGPLWAIRKMKIFTDKPRDYEGIRTPGESTIDFLDRSSFPWASDVRQYLNKWVEKYPSNEVADLLSRMHNDIESPFYELFLHELFSQLEFDITIHPELPESSKKPDFLIKNGINSAYLEARLVTETSDSERTMKARKEQILNQINKSLKSQSFFISIRELALKSNQTGSLKHFIRQLDDFINNKDPDLVEAIYESRGIFDDYGTFVYENDNVYISVGLIPRKKEYRDQPQDRIIGITGGGARWLDTVTAIRTRITKKSGKYGQLNKPFIIGLNLTSPFGLHWDDIIDALYGSRF